MNDECLTKPCAACGGRITGPGFYCPDCKTCICFYCGMTQIRDCHDVEILKSETLPKCPKCGAKLD